MSRKVTKLKPMLPSKVFIWCLTHVLDRVVPRIQLSSDRFRDPKKIGVLPARSNPPCEWIPLVGNVSYCQQDAVPLLPGDVLFLCTWLGSGEKDMVFRLNIKVPGRAAGSRNIVAAKPLMSDNGCFSPLLTIRWGHDAACAFAKSASWLVRRETHLAHLESGTHRTGWTEFSPSSFPRPQSLTHHIEKEAFRVPTPERRRTDFDATERSN